MIKRSDLEIARLRQMLEAYGLRLDVLEADGGGECVCDLTDVENDIATLSGTLGVVEAAVDTQKNRINNASGTLGVVETQVDTTKNNLYTTSGTLGVVEALADTIKNNLYATSGTLGVVEALADTTKNNLNATSGTLGIVEAAVDTQKNRINNASGTLGVVEAALDTAKNDINDLQADLAAFSPETLVGAGTTDILLHFNGGNGSTAFADSSPNAFTLTKNGSIAQSTTVSKFGASVGKFLQNSTQYLAINPGVIFDWGANPDVIISSWIRPTSFAAFNIIVERAANVNNRWLLYLDAGRLKFTVIVAGVVTLGAALVGPTLFADTWFYVEVTLHEHIWVLSVNGVVWDKTIDNTTTYDSTFGSVLRIGEDAFTTGNSFDGYMDEFRIAHDQYRNVGFATPTAAWANSP